MPPTHNNNNNNNRPHATTKRGGTVLCVASLLLCSLIGMGFGMQRVSVFGQTPPRTGPADHDRFSSPSSHPPVVVSPSPVRLQQQQQPFNTTSSVHSSPTCSISGETAVICMIAHGWQAKGYEDERSIKGSRRSMDLALRGIFHKVTHRCALHFIFITGEDDEARIRSLIGQVRHAHTNITFQFQRLDEAQLQDWMSYIGHVATHRTGAAGNVKFFYPLLFPNQDRVLMLDSDILVNRDVCELWAHFSLFGPKQLFAFAPQKHPISITKDNQFNAGVALLHLQRMRQANWLELARRSIQNWHEKGMIPKCCAHGDQSVFHMIRFFDPQSLVHYLPRWWNINKCHQFQHFDTYQRHWQERLEQNATLRALVHRRAVLWSGSGGGGVAGCEWFPQQGQGQPRWVMPLPGEVYVGLVHLGCCKMCRRDHLKGRWRQLLDDIEAKDLTTVSGAWHVHEVSLIPSR